MGGWSKQSSEDKQLQSPFGKMGRRSEGKQGASGKRRQEKKKQKEIPRPRTDKVYPVQLLIREYLNGTEPGHATTVCSCRWEYIRDGT